MVDYKRQHYVPKFYLRRFSPSPERINLLNIQRKLPIIGASLKTQAYEDYFYGSDLQLENMLATLEQNIASLISGIVERGIPPSQYSEEHISILYYTVLQNARTLYTAQMVDDMTNQTFVEIMSKDPKVTTEMLEKVQYGFENPANFAMGAASDGFALATDLGMKIIRNISCINIITSDNPVVFYNKLFDHRTYVGNTGFQSKGLLIFFPLDPRTLILYYDTTTYKVGDRKKKYVNVSSLGDIKMLNRLQLTNCNENVYFKSKTDISHLIPESYKTQPYRRKIRTSLQIHKMNKRPNSELMQLKPEDLHINLTLSFLTIQKKTKKWLRYFETIQYQPVFVPRDIRLSGKYEEYRELSRKGAQHPLGFIGFLGEN